MTQIDVTAGLQILDGRIADCRANITGLQRHLDTLLEVRALFGETKDEPKLLPPPKKVKKSKSVPQERKPHRPRKDVDTDCPLDWELAGVSFTLKLNEALIMRRLTEGEGTEAEIVSQEALLDCLGRPSVAVMFTALRGLRTALYDHRTAHMVETVPSEGYRLVAEGE